MGWAIRYIDELKKGNSVTFCPRGNSMQGLISSGQKVTVDPLKDKSVQKGHVVLCKVNGSEYLHLVTALKGKQYQISNNKGRVNGWININNIYGIWRRNGQS